MGGGRKTQEEIKKKKTSKKEYINIWLKNKVMKQDLSESLFWNLLKLKIQTQKLFLLDTVSYHLNT